MEQRKNLCAQLPLSLHERITEASGMLIFGAAFVSRLGETEPFHCVRDGKMVCAGIEM